MLNEILWAAGMTTVTQCYSIRGVRGYCRIKYRNNDYKLV